jgi:hypothetical protein
MIHASSERPHRIAPYGGIAEFAEAIRLCVVDEFAANPQLPDPKAPLRDQSFELKGYRNLSCLIGSWRHQFLTMVEGGEHQIGYLRNPSFCERLDAHFDDHAQDSVP